nr:MAG TPA: hypothetical protein [Caudoviricetes sp.]
MKMVLISFNLYNTTSFHRVNEIKTNKSTIK